MQADGSVISLPDRDGKEGDECCSWFMDAAEARLTLKRVVASNPDLAGLKLQTFGLGDFLVLADGWPRKGAPPSAPDAAVLKLQERMASPVNCSADSSDRYLIEFPRMTIPFRCRACTSSRACSVTSSRAR